jgi:glycosyltransferase involved in cell wall biosynthesis
MKQILFVNTQAPLDPAAGGIASYIRHRAWVLSESMVVWWSDGRSASRFDRGKGAWEEPFPIQCRNSAVFSRAGNWWLPRSPLWAFLIRQGIESVEFPDGVTAQWPAEKPFHIFIMCHTTQDVRRFLSRYPVQFRHWVKQGLIKRCIQTADRVAACSHEIMWMTSGFYHIHPDRFSVLPHFFCREAEDFSLPNLVREPLFLYVGNIEYFKGFDLVVEGYRRYRRRGGGAVLAVAGSDGWKDNDNQTRLMLKSEPVRRLVQEEGEKSLVFLGRLTKQQVAERRSRCLACIVGSRFEAFTMVAGEAFLSETPLILSTRTGWRALAAHYRAARLNDPYDADDMAQAFFEMENPALRESLVAGGRDLASFLTGEKLSNATKDWYNS